MSVRRGPTERDRSEGTLTKEGPNREHKPLVTWGFIKLLAEGETVCPQADALDLVYSAPLTYSTNLTTAGAFSWRRWISDNDELGWQSSIRRYTTFGKRM